MRYIVTTPVEGHTGEVGGVHFVHGRAVVDSDDPRQRAALVYFRSRGYGVTEDGSGPAEPVPVPRPAQAADKAAWVAWAVQCGAEQAEAEAATKADLIEQYGKGDA